MLTYPLFGCLHAIPREIDEAAAVDGAGPLRTLWLIVLTAASSDMVTTGPIVFIASWNEVVAALAFVPTIDHQPIPVGVANVQNLHRGPWGDLAAASVVVTLPLVAMVLVFQRRIIAGFTQGAVEE